MRSGARAKRRLLDLNAELEARVAERTRALEAEAAERREAEAEIRQMQKMEAIGQLTGGIAHDFNNMLAIVIGSLDLARRRLHRAARTPRSRACIDNAAEGARRAAVLTARLLAFSRQQPLEPQALDVNRLVAGMSELLRRTIGEHDRGRDRARRRPVARLRRSRPARERADQPRASTRATPCPTAASSPSRPPTPISTTPTPRHNAEVDARPVCDARRSPTPAPA